MATSGALVYLAATTGSFCRQSLSLFSRQGSKKSKCLLKKPSCWFLERNRRFSTIEKENERLFSEVNIEIKGNDEAVLDSYSKFIKKAAECLDIEGTQVALPRNTERYTILKSPHIYKKHRVQYEIRTHRLLVQFKELTGATSDVFLEYIQRNCPEGVSMDIQQTELEELRINIPPEVQKFLETQNEGKSNRSR